MNSPDLIQRIYYQKDKGDNTHFHQVADYLRNGPFEFDSCFAFGNQSIHWTCFESNRFYDIIKEPDNYVYVYLYTHDRSMETIITAHTEESDRPQPLQDRIPILHYLWVIGDRFPGLPPGTPRPLKINLPTIWGIDYRPMRYLGFWLQKMLLEYAHGKKPIYEVIDYPKGGQPWRKVKNTDAR